MPPIQGRSPTRGSTAAIDTPAMSGSLKWRGGMWLHKIHKIIEKHTTPFGGPIGSGTETNGRMQL